MFFPDFSPSYSLQKTGLAAPVRQPIQSGQGLSWAPGPSWAPSPEGFSPLRRREGIPPLPPTHRPTHLRHCALRRFARVMFKNAVLYEVFGPSATMDFILAI